MQDFYASPVYFDFAMLFMSACNTCSYFVCFVLIVFFFLFFGIGFRCLHFHLRLQTMFSLLLLLLLLSSFFFLSFLFVHALSRHAGTQAPTNLDIALFICRQYACQHINIAILMYIYIYIYIRVCTVIHAMHFLCHRHWHSTSEIFYTPRILLS